MFICVDIRSASCCAEPTSRHVPRLESTRTPLCDLPRPAGCHRGIGERPKHGRRKEGSVKVLYVAPRLPAPALDRENVRPYQQLRYLALHHDVDLIAFGDPASSGEKRSTLGRFCTRIQVVTPPRTSPVAPATARHLLTTQALAVRLYESRGFMERLESLARWECYDVVFVHSAGMAPYGSAFEETPKIVDLVEASSRRWTDAGSRRGLLTSAMFRREGKRLRAVEQRALGQYDEVLVASESAARALREHGIHPERVSVQRTPCPPHARIRRRPSALPTILLAGHMDHLPNVDAALHFAAQVFPRVRQAVLDAVLRIAGRKPPAEVRALAGHRAIFVDPGHLDIRAHYAEAWVAVAPHQSEYGVRNEVLESLSMGIATVASKEACVGIDLAPETDIEVAASPQDMAERVIRLLLDTRRRDQLAYRARRGMQTHYASGVGESRLEDLVMAVGSRHLIPA